MMRCITCPFSFSFSLALAMFVLLNLVICSKDAKLKKKRTSGATDLGAHSVSIPSTTAKSPVGIIIYEQPSLNPTEALNYEQDFSPTEAVNYEQDFSPTEADIEWKVVKINTDEEKDKEKDKEKEKEKEKDKDDKKDVKKDVKKDGKKDGRKKVKKKVKKKDYKKDYKKDDNKDDNKDGNKDGNKDDKRDDKDKKVQQMPLRGILKKPESPKSNKRVQFKEENELFNVPRLIYTSESTSEVSPSTTTSIVGDNGPTNKKITTTRVRPILVAPQMVPLKPPADDVFPKKKRVYEFTTIQEEVEDEEESESEDEYEGEGSILLSKITEDAPSLNLLSWPNPFLPIPFGKHMMIMDILSTIAEPNYENLWEATVNYFSKHRPRIHRDKIRLHTQSNSNFLLNFMSYLAGKPDSRPTIEVWWEADPSEVNLSTPFPHDDEALEQFFSKTTVYQFVWKKAYTWKPLQFILGGPKQDKIAYLLFTDMTNEQIQQFHLPNTGDFIPSDKWQEKAWRYDVDCHYSNWPPRY